MKNITNKTLRKYRGIFAHQQWNSVTRQQREEYEKTIQNPVFMSNPFDAIMKLVGRGKPKKNNHIKVIG